MKHAIGDGYFSIDVGSPADARSPFADSLVSKYFGDTSPLSISKAYGVTLSSDAKVAAVASTPHLLDLISKTRG